MYQISLKSNNFSQKYGDITILKITAVRHLGFLKFAAFVMHPLSACRSASAYKISPKSDNRLMSYGQQTIFKMAAVAISNLKISIFGHVAVIGFNI